MRRRMLLAATLIAASALPIAAEPVKGNFIGPGTYAWRDGGCAKLDAIAKGGPKNIETTPETLDADGLHHWETGCSFKSIKEVAKGRKWVARMVCHNEDGKESPETNTFVKQRDGSIEMIDGDGKVVNDGTETVVFVRCDAGKGK